MTTAYQITVCPVCAASASELVADGEQLAAEHRLLQRRHARRAGSERHDQASFTQDTPLRLVRCVDCGLLYRNPAERWLREIYEQELTPLDALRRLQASQRAAFRPATRRLTRLHGGPGVVLEVGSYSGAFLHVATEAGWRCTAVDVNPRVVAFLRADGWDVAEGSIDEVPPEACYDAVAFWNCFEQLADPGAAARAAWQRLRAGGLLALRVPNGGYYAALRPHLRGARGLAVRALLARHNFLGFPYRYGFTRASLERVLGTAGFEVAEVHGAGVLPAADGARRARVRLLDAAARALRSFAGDPWIELYAVRR